MGAFKWVQGPPQWDWGDLAFFLQSRRIGLNSEYIKGRRGLRLRSREGVSGSGITKRITQRSTKCPGFWRSNQPPGEWWWVPEEGWCSGQRQRKGRKGRAV